MNTTIQKLDRPFTPGRFVWLRHESTGAGSSWIKFNAGTPQTTDVIDLQGEQGVLLRMAASRALRPRLGVHLGRPALILDDPGGVPVSTLLLAGPLDLAAALRMALDLCASLKDLHRSGLVHHGLSARVVLRAGSGEHFALFDAADAVPRTAAMSVSPDALDTLRYAAPESTGRLGVRIDERADLYALGVLMYQCLTGQLPFISDDPLELIHAHVARTPTPPTSLDGHIPAVLSDIVMKLHAKAPEARYQSADALSADLARCLRSLQSGGSIPSFKLASQDGELNLFTPPQLYGRAGQIRELSELFDSVCNVAETQAKLALVLGPAGAGKTSAVESLQGLVAERGGYFVSGKFDQVVQGRPFAAWAQAFRALTLKLLTQDDADLAQWRGALRKELGSHAAVVTEMVPEMSLLVGKQSRPPFLGATESINRFRAAFSQLLSVFARHQRPLLIFLDDLQWADEASRDLLESLLRSNTTGALLLVASCRTDDVSLDAFCKQLLEAQEGRVHRLNVFALEPSDLVQMLSDLLDLTTSEVADLAGAIHAKTGGNPFFVKEALRSWRREGLISFDVECAKWTYDLEAIRNTPLTDNVVDLIARRVRGLPKASQALLVLASMLGGTFSVHQLALISSDTAGQCSQRLEAALEAGLVAVASPDDVAPVCFCFAHDRFQQAAYALTPPSERPLRHLRLGQRLLTFARQPADGLSLPDPLPHLNHGRALLEDPADLLDLAQLNFIAGMRAKVSAAFAQAATYFSIAVELTENAGWHRDQSLSFSCGLELAQTLCLSDRIQEADPVFAQLLQRAQGSVDAAKVLSVWAVQRERLSDFSSALDLGRQALVLLGQPLAVGEEQISADLVMELSNISRALQHRDVASLVDLPEMSDPVVRMRIEILINMWSSAYITGNAPLSRLISAQMVRLSIEHGNAEESAYGYVTHAITMGPFLGDFKGAFELGQLALAVNARFNDVQRRAKILQQFQAHVNLWLQPFQSCVSIAQEAYRAGLAQGDHLYAAYAAGSGLWSAMLCTDNLTRFVSEHQHVIAAIEKLESRGFADSVRVLFNWARTLIGLDTPHALSTFCIDEDIFETKYRDNPFFMGIYLVTRQAAAGLLDQYDDAYEYGRQAEAMLPRMTGTIWPVVQEFWQAMTVLARLPPPGSIEREQTLLNIELVCRRFEVLAGHCASNFEGPYRLLLARLAHARGHVDQARSQLLQACDFAELSGNPQLQGQALSLLGLVELEHGHRSHARALLNESKSCFARWGAEAKVRQLQQAYKDLWVNVEAPDSHATNEPMASVQHKPSLHSDNVLDLFSMIKASQAIVGEVDWDRLLRRLMNIIIESAGAHRGTLVLERDGAHFHYAVNAQDGPFEDSNENVPTEDVMSALPMSIIHHVKRTHETIVLNDAAQEDRFSYDPYVLRHGMRSVLCTPLLNQARLIGVLFLENSMVCNAFNEERVRAVSVLTAQAAVSIDNAELVAGLRLEIEQRTQTEQQLKSALDEVQRLRHDLEAENTYLRRDLIANLSHDLRTPLASIRGYLEVLINKADNLPPEIRLNYKGIALRQTNYLADLTEQLLELAKLDFKGVELQRESLKLSELVFDVAQKFVLTAQGQQVELYPDLATDDPFVQADARLIERVLDNLIGNALQHTPAGGRVTVKVTTTSAGVQVEVRDTGKGIEAKQLPFIFNRFFRGSGSHKQQSVGAGLGLAITKRILELHGSTIRVQSQSGSGSSFAFLLT